MEIFNFPGAEIVDNADLVPQGNQPVLDVRADESRSAGNQDVHFAYFNIFIHSFASPYEI